MNFQPVVPFSGTAGWAFLKRTEGAQRAAFEASPLVQKDVDYFRENISKVQKPEDLVSDYRLMKVALGAFGLDDDLPNKAFIRKVLEEGSVDPASFANRMVDKRYLALTEAFGFDLGTPSTQLSDFSAKIIERYQDRQFEIAVGEQSNDMRLALALERDLSGIIESDTTDNGRWFSVMGNEPLRQVFQTALGLPPEIATIDIDKQVEVFRDKSASLFGGGEVTDFSAPDKMEELNRLFLVRSQMSQGASALSSGSIALQLLRTA